MSTTGSARPPQPPHRTGPEAGPAGWTDAAGSGPVDMAVDTVAAILRSLGEHALDQENMEASVFRGLCERWAQHVTLATPPPGGTAAVGGAKDGRRDWLGVRELVRNYCRGSAARARTITGDLRQVVWVFI